MSMFTCVGGAEAQHVLGQAYMVGNGVPQDTHLAYHWWLLAAAQGHAHACYDIATAHFDNKLPGYDDRFGFRFHA